MMKENSYYIDVEVEFDALQTDPLLQQSLLYTSPKTDNNNNTSKENAHKENRCYTICEKENGMTLDRLTPHKRKLSLIEASSSSFFDAVSVSSDTSGRFDDANESDGDICMDPPIMTASSTTAEATAAAAMLAAATPVPPAVPAAAAADEEEERSVHSAKRGRSNGWPLQNEIAYDENGMRIDRSEKHPTTTKTEAVKQSTEEDCRHRCVRQSRFIEGSMNDRVSQKPPSIYFQDKHEYEHDYDHEQHEGENKKQNVEKRSSGIFRFGKAIASAFHPFGAWNSSSSSSNNSGQAGKSQKDVMKQRQARAEKAYAELKKSGFRGTSSSVVAGAGNKVDANIADQTWKAIQEKMDYKLPGESRSQENDMLVVPKSVSKLKSFSELRKRTSTLSIPAMRARDVSSPVTLTVPVKHDETEQKQIERRQSRKELNRQAKLMKRVSNLEDKLLRARRELREFSVVEQQQQQQQAVVPTICVDDCVDDVRPVLPTVPSERVLEEQGMLLSDIEYETMQEPQQQQQQPRAKWPPVDSLSRKRKPVAIVECRPVAAENETIPDAMDIEQDFDADCGKPSSTTTNTNTNTTPKKSKHKSKHKSKSDGDKEAPNKLKSNRDKRASSLTTKASQRLKAKQSSRNLRQSTPTPIQTEEKEKPLQEQEGNANAARSPASVSGSAAGGEWQYNGAENIPPVPPVPKELLHSANVSSSKEAKKGNAKAGKDSNKRIPSREFAWPEDIF